MPEILLASVEFSGYISIVKLIIFLVLFFPYLALINWAYDDARAIGSNERVWVGVLLSASWFSALLWLLIPAFIIGMLLYVIAAGSAALMYVMHRNAQVTESEKVLTAEHISSLFGGSAKRKENSESITFVSTNNNEIPVPEPKTPEHHGFRVAHDLFEDCIARRTSNILLKSGRENYKMAYIIDGARLPQADMPSEQVEYLCNFLKQLAGLDLNEKRKPQKGNFTIRKEDHSSQWELSTAGSTVGEQIQINQKTVGKILRLSELNLLPDQYKQISTIKDMDKGLFLIAGPRMSGVTTTKYAMIRTHDAFLNSISSLEYEPSAELPNVTQEVYSLSDSGTTTYAKKLQAIARMSPDVLGVADVKDSETAKVASNAAKEGAIVYATIEADNAANALGKWIKLVGDRKLVAQTLVGVSNQRLFRKLCPECKQAYEPNKELFRKFNIPPGKTKVLYREGKVVYDKRGKAYPCETCHEIGFMGRTCVFETVMITRELQKAIVTSKNLQELAMHLRKSKMKYLQEQMLEMVLDGTTSINEMIRLFSNAKQSRPK